MRQRKKQEVRPAFTAPLEDEPVPPRRGRRWSVGLLALCGTLLLSWLAWDRYAWHRFEAEVARLKGEGEPIWEEDFDTAPVPDSENAAVLLKRAAGSIHYSGEQNSHWMDNFYTPPLSPAAVDSLGRMIEANRPALADARRARELRSADWGPWDSDDPADYDALRRDLETLNRQRELAQLLSFATRHAHARGDDGEAVALIQDMLATGRATSGRGPVVSFLVGGGMVAMAAEEAQSLGPGLRVGGAPGEARREDVDQLIAGLLDDSWVGRDRLLVIRFERARLARVARPDFTHYLRHAGLMPRHPDSVTSWEDLYMDVAPRSLDAAVDRVARPCFLLRAARLLRYSGDLASAATRPGAAPPRYPEVPGTSWHLTKLFGVHWCLEAGPTASPPGSFSLPGVAPLEAGAAVGLAARLYQIDHGGRPPSANAALVPGYLPALPSNVKLLSVSVAPATAPATSPAPTRPATQPAAGAPPG